MASALGRMAGAHPVSAVVIELAHKKGMIVGRRHPPRLRLAGEPLLDPLPDLNVHDSRMKAVMGLPFVAQPSDIDWVRQDPVEVTSRDRYAAGRPATPAHPGGQRTFSVSRAALRRTTLPSSR